MKLFKSDNPKRRMSRLINEFQYSMQSGDYWTARKAVEQALRMDPDNVKLHDMENMTLQLITMQDEQRGTSRGHAKAQKTPPKAESKSRVSPHDFDDVKEAVDSFRTAFMNGDAETSASLWDEAASALVYVTAEDGEVHKGFYEVRNALRTKATRNEYVTHELVDQGIDHHGALVCAFYKVSFERNEHGFDKALPGTLAMTLVLRKTGDAWKIVQGHESTVLNTPPASEV